MTNELNILWIKPPEMQLKLVPGKNSISLQIPEMDRDLSYDVQSNYPITPLISAIRQLKSASKWEINPSLLNLAAVPRSTFIDGSWRNSYRSKPIKRIQFGKSHIEVRRLGVDVCNVHSLDDIVKGQDLVVITSSYEMNANEARRIGEYLKARYGNLLLMGAGLGIETREEEFLRSGFDLCFSGTVLDRGEEVLDALVNRDTRRLRELPGVYTNLDGETIRNVGARNFRQPQIIRSRNIMLWRQNLHKYLQFVDVKPSFLGRPDLSTPLVDADSTVEYCCAFQDLPLDTVVKIAKAGDRVVFGADDISPSVGCFRSDCDFCSSSGKGYATNKREYVLSLLNYYASLGVTDIIPTDDAFLPATTNPRVMEDMIAIFKRMKEREISLFTGNGLSTYSIGKLIEGAKAGEESTEKFLEVFTDVVGYFYLPIERLYALTGENTGTCLTKLENAKQAFHAVLRHISDNSPRDPVEIATNIILPSATGKEDISRYYAEMDRLMAQYPRLHARYVGFFEIPTNSARHIEDLRKTHDLLFSDANPELKVVSVPTILKNGESSDNLEMRLVWNILARNASHTARKLYGGTYNERV